MSMKTCNWELLSPEGRVLLNSRLSRPEGVLHASLSVQIDGNNVQCFDTIMWFNSLLRQIFIVVCLIH